MDYAFPFESFEEARRCAEMWGTSQENDPEIIMKRTEIAKVYPI